MQGKSTSFKQITPFQPKSGLLGSSYVAFPLDIGSPVIVPEPEPPIGCLYVPPAMAPHEPGVFDLGTLVSFAGGVASTDRWPIGFIMSEDGKRVAVTAGWSPDRSGFFTRLPGDSIDFTFEHFSVDPVNEGFVQGISRAYVVVGQTDQGGGG